MKEFKEIVREAFENVVMISNEEIGFDVESKRMEFAKFGIVPKKMEDAYMFSHYSRMSQKAKSCGHKYIMPSFFEEVVSLCACSDDYTSKSVNVLLVGGKGTGKSEFVHELGKMKFGRVYQVNGREDMDSSDFFGDKTVVVDKETKQNFITFNKGPLYKAFIEGTEVDENGDQILYNEKGERVYDDSGEPKVIGKPALFFLDEFAAILPSVFLAVFNRAMEIPRESGKSRTIEITTDGGRVVKSHPGFVMFLSGNTVGKGIENESQMGYTAQNNLMDDSTLDRISATYHFGYNLYAERKIMYQKLRDEKLIEQFEDFVRKIRKLFDEGKIETILSTRAIVQICDMYSLMKVFEKEKAMPKAIYRSVFAQLREREKAGWNEVIRYGFGVDMVNEFGRSEKDMWYPAN